MHGGSCRLRPLAKHAIVFDEEERQHLVVARADGLLAEFVSVSAAPVEPSVGADFTRRWAIRLSAISDFALINPSGYCWGQADASMSALSGPHLRASTENLCGTADAQMLGNQKRLCDGNEVNHQSASNVTLTRECRENSLA
jgi:hypothetical protein